MLIYVLYESGDLYTASCYYIILYPTFACYLEGRRPVSSVPPLRACAVVEPLRSAPVSPIPCPAVRWSVHLVSHVTQGSCGRPVSDACSFPSRMTSSEKIGCRIHCTDNNSDRGAQLFWTRAAVGSRTKW